MNACKRYSTLVIILVIIGLTIYHYFTNKTLDDYIDMSQSDNPWDRAYAAHALSEFKDQKAIDSLITSCADPFYEVRANAIRSLTEIGDNSILPVILEHVDDEHYWVRSEVAKSLIKFGNESQMPIVNTLLCDDSIDVQEKAIWALGSIEGSNAIPKLRKKLEGSNGAIRYVILYELFEIGDSQSIPFIISHMKRSRYDKEKVVSLFHKYIDVPFLGSDPDAWLRWYENNKSNIVWDAENLQYTIQSNQ